jgi:hypothetical protein
MAKTAILLHLDPQMLEELNQLAGLINIPRSELIRRCLSRDLQFVRNVEVAGLKSVVESSSREYGRFLESAGKTINK